MAEKKAKEEKVEEAPALPTDLEVLNERLGVSQEDIDNSEIVPEPEPEPVVEAAEEVSDADGSTTKTSSTAASTKKPATKK